MATVVEALNRIARKCSVSEPDSWLTATSTEHVEIRDDFLLECVDEIQRRCVLPSPLSGSFEITADGSETYTLPSDFLRLQDDKLSVYESTNLRRALAPITSDGAWTHLKSVGPTGFARYFRLTGYAGNWSISIYREPTSGNTITVHYVSRNWMQNSAGTDGYAFTDPSDILLIPRRLIELGTVCRWRERKGVPYDSTLAEFEAELERYTNQTKTRRSIGFGDPYMDRKPWDVPVPDYIPES